MKTINASAQSNVLRVLFTGLAATYLGLHAPVSQAADVVSGETPRAIAVQYGDLNLANTEGVKRLYQRITNAAHDVCETRGDRSLKNAALAKICISQSIAQAVTAANRPELTALYLSKTDHQAKLAQR